MRAEVVVVGASTGGVAAALAAAQFAGSVLIVEATEWVGGQFSAQGVCTPDENPWIETSGGTRSYLQFRERVRNHYKRTYRLSAKGAAQERFSPGLCWVSRLSMEPRVAHNLLLESLQSCGNVTTLFNTRITSAEMEGDQIRSLYAVGAEGEQVTIEGNYFLDATELGDLLPLVGAEFLLGAEGFEETREPDAPPLARPDWIQPFTIPFAIEMRPHGEDHTIHPPHDYEELKAIQKYHVVDGAMKGMFGEFSWWNYRRIVAAEQFDDPAFPYDIAMINTASNDFKGGEIPHGELDEETLATARRASLGYLYWLQTECPRVDRPGELGYPEFKLRGDLFGTPDGLAPMPYIRESRRIKALTTVYEQDIVAADGAGNPHQTGPRARQFKDSCGIGSYWLDVHDGGTNEPNRFLNTRPFQIPMGALIPVRIKNLLAACKNLGVTHLTNGAYRLHPIEWNVGESAGALAAFCVHQKVNPHGLYADSGLRGSYQRLLVAMGIPLVWWSDMPQDHPAFEAVQLLSVRGDWPVEESLEFRPEDLLTKIEAVTLGLPHGASRADAAMELARRTLS